MRRFLNFGECTHANEKSRKGFPIFIFGEKKKNQNGTFQNFEIIHPGRAKKFC
jgi:hypothetical protein